MMAAAQIGTQVVTQIGTHIHMILHEAGELSATLRRRLAMGRRITDPNIRDFLRVQAALDEARCRSIIHYAKTAAKILLGGAATIAVSTAIIALPIIHVLKQMGFTERQLQETFVKAISSGSVDVFCTTPIPESTFVTRIVLGGHQFAIEVSIRKMDESTVPGNNLAPRLVKSARSRSFKRRFDAAFKRIESGLPATRYVCPKLHFIQSTIPIPNGRGSRSQCSICRSWMPMI